MSPCSHVGYVLLLSYVLAVRTEVANERHPRPHVPEVVDGEVDLCLVGDGQQVQHGVRGSAQCEDDGDGVLDGLAGDDVACTQL